MDEKLITIVLHYDGIFRRSGFSPGKTLPVAKVPTEEFSYSVLMEYVKDYLHLTEIGGVYTRDGNSWRLLTKDKELLELVDRCENDGEMDLYVDTVVDKRSRALGTNAATCNCTTEEEHYYRYYRANQGGSEAPIRDYSPAPTATRKEKEGK